MGVATLRARGGEDRRRVALALLRSRRQPRYEGWRLLHIALEGTVFVAAWLHGWWPHHLSHYAMIAAWFAVMGVVVLAVAVRRWLWLPLRSRRRSYVVERVAEVAGDAVTLEVRLHRAAARCASGTPRVPGRALRPADDRRSGLLVGLRLRGRRYRRDPDAELRTLADRGDRRRHLLLVGARSESDIVLRAEIEELRERLSLAVVYVLNHPPQSWAGEWGRIDGPLLDRWLPPQA